MPVSESTIRQIEAWWAPDQGVLRKLRQGEFDVEALEALVAFLKEIQVGEDELLPRRFVSLLWHLPPFMGWQRERVQKKGGDMQRFLSVHNRIVGQVERILGMP